MKSFLFVFFSFILVWLSGCATNNTSQNIEQSSTWEKVNFTLPEWFRSSWEESILNYAFSQPKAILFFENEKKPIIIWQVWSVRLDETEWYEFTINNDQNYELFINSKYDSTMKYKKAYVIECNSGEVCPQTWWQYQNELIEELIPTEVTDIVIIKWENRVAIKWQDWDRVEKVKKWP